MLPTGALLEEYGCLGADNELGELDETFDDGAADVAQQRVRLVDREVVWVLGGVASGIKQKTSLSVSYNLLFG